MKKYSLLFIYLILLIGSCKKECRYADKPTDSKFKGKVKSLKEYNGNDTTLYYFYYDSLTGNLHSASLKYYGPSVLNSDTLTSFFYLEKQDDASIYIRNSQNQYINKVMVYNQQIIGEYYFDSITNQGFNSTSVYFNSNNTKVEYISSASRFAFFTDIYYDNFIYDLYNNCSNYTAHWTETVSGFPVEKQADYGFRFTTLTNTKMLYKQIPGDVLGDFDQISHLNADIYILGIAGYYVVQPNKYLIDSMLYSATDAYYKYNYTFTDGNISKVSILGGANSTPRTETYYQEYTYY
ncbi:MAG: hypothetical protein U0U67_15175 [Chitinophagales bacterium]